MEPSYKPKEEHNIFLNEDLMSIDYASARLDTEGAWQATVWLRRIEDKPPAWYCVAVPHMSAPHLDSELKKGSAEFLILSLVEDRALHGYDIARLIDVRSKGALTFYAASLYPLLYRLERRGWITGRWVEQAGARRRRMYRITAAGRRVLAAHRTTWDAFVRAVNLVTGTDRA